MQKPGREGMTHLRVSKKQLAHESQLFWPERIDSGKAAAYELTGCWPRELSSFSKGRYVYRVLALQRVRHIRSLQPGEAWVMGYLDNIWKLACFITNG